MTATCFNITYSHSFQWCVVFVIELFNLLVINLMGTFQVFLLLIYWYLESLIFITQLLIFRLAFKENLELCLVTRGVEESIYGGRGLTLL